jgi:hypothetical protein
VHPEHLPTGPLEEEEEEEEEVEIEFQFPFLGRIFCL